MERLLHWAHSDVVRRADAPTRPGRGRPADPGARLARMRAIAAQNARGGGKPRRAGWGRVTAPPELALAVLAAPAVRAAAGWSLPSPRALSSSWLSQAWPPMAVWGRSG